MTEENQKNTVATVGMWFSIIGLIALITVFFAWLWFPMLLVWFILWIIGLFYKPRWKARIAIIIPLIVFIILVSITCYIWNSIKTPAGEFIERAKPQWEQLEDENFDEDRFENILETEINKITNNKSSEDREVLFKTSTGSNFLEKWSYLFFSITRESLESAIEKYNNELPEINDTENASEDDDNNKNDATEKITEDVTIFTESEQDDIEQILDLLE